MRKPLITPRSGIEDLVSTGAQKQSSAADAFYHLVAELPHQIANRSVIYTFKPNEERSFYDAGGLYIVKQGALCRVRVVSDAESVKSIMSGVFRKGDIMEDPVVMHYKKGTLDDGVKEGALDDSKPYFICTALERSRVEHVPLDRLNEIVDYTRERHPDLFFELFSLRARIHYSQLRQVHELIDLWVFENSPNRILATMTRLANADGNGTLVAPGLTHERYGGLIGIARETFTVEINKFVKAKMVKERGGRRVAKPYEIKINLKKK